MKLFDTKLTEPCGSSILSLVQDFNIDYDVTVSGEKFIDIVIDHLDERDFLLDYAKKLEKAYLKVNPNYYTLLQNCICKSVETLDTKSIYKAFVKNGLMDRLQWKLTTKKLLELQK